MKKRFRKLVTMTLIITLLFTGNALAFSDIQNHWAEGVINWGHERIVLGKPMIAGYPDGTFKPNNSVTEAEFLTMILRGYGLELDRPEKNPNHWADSAYVQAVDERGFVVEGRHDISKRGFVITRTQVAEIVAATQGYQYDGRDAIHYLLLNGLAKGKDPDNITIANYGGNDRLTRAEAVQFIKNVLENGNRSIHSGLIKLGPVLPKIGDHDNIIPLKKVDQNKKGTAPDHDLLTDLNDTSTSTTQPTNEGNLTTYELSKYMAKQYNDLFLSYIKLEDNGVSGYNPTPPDNYEWAWIIAYEYKPEFNPNPARQFPFYSLVANKVNNREKFLAEIPMDKITNIEISVSLQPIKNGVPNILTTVYYPLTDEKEELYDY